MLRRRINLIKWDSFATDLCFSALPERALLFVCTPAATLTSVSDALSSSGCTLLTGMSNERKKKKIMTVYLQKSTHPAFNSTFIADDLPFSLLFS